MQDIVLTGIKPTGKPHIGNYFGAIKPIIESSSNADKTLVFIADYHALNTIKDPKVLQHNTLELACTWLACGADASNILLYKQSDVPEVFELSWILNNVTPKGLLNRAHAYKATVEANQVSGNEPDDGVNMGLYSYPVLMAADILLMNSTKVPVGLDQKQHIEITKEIVRVFNNTYGNVLVSPEGVIDDKVKVINGLDGRKMSKSYDNVIDLFGTENDLKKKINRVVTNSQLPEEPKDINCSIFKIYELFATPAEVDNMKKAFKQGIGWGEVKKATFEVANRYLSPMRQKYEYFMAHPKEVEQILKNNALQVRKVAIKTLERVRKAIGKI